MDYSKIMDYPFIFGVCKGNSGDTITEEEYYILLNLLQTRPTNAPDGFCYKLRADTLEWELVELPPAPEPEPSEDVDDSEALDIILGVSE